MLGWMIYIVLFTFEIDTVIATLAASFVVAVVSQIFAKMYKTPVIIFSVASESGFRICRKGPHYPSLSEAKGCPEGGLSITVRCLPS